MEQRKYFLKNSNLREEMAKSKLTYCCYEKSEYGKYDIICGDYNLITPNILKAFFDKHPNRDNIIIRVMTNEHVIDYCNNKKINLQFLKMTPFKHFLLNREDFDNLFIDDVILPQVEDLNNKNEKLKEEIKLVRKNIRNLEFEKEKQIPFKEKEKELRQEVKENIQKIGILSKTFSEKIISKSKEVLRSHWKGDTIETGHFDVSQGKITDNLVYMIMMLVDQYAKSGNWVGYTYLDDMKGAALVHLCDVALKYEELKSDNVFAYFTQVASNIFKATINKEKQQSYVKSVLLQNAGYNATFNEQTNESFKNILYDENGNEIIED